MADDTAAPDVSATPNVPATPAAEPRPATSPRAAKPRAKRAGTGRARAASHSPGEHVRGTAGRVRKEVNGAELDLEEHVAGLSEQLADLAERVEWFAAEFALHARHLASAASDAGLTASRSAGRHIVGTARAVRDDPLPTVAAFGVLALLAAVVLSRRDERW